MSTDYEVLLKQWALEAEATVALMNTLPPGRYDFRPDPEGRSIGELAWHLAEVDAYVTVGIAQGAFRFDVKPPHLERPRTVEALAPAFRVVHDEAVARLRPLSATDLDRQVTYADGTAWTIRDLLWRKVLLHGAHHRGQLALLCRMAGGVPVGLYGPNREETLARRSAAAARPVVAAATS
jgi:uncharacterized damage-inducible protein DinB